MIPSQYRHIYSRKLCETFIQTQYKTVCCSAPQWQHRSLIINFRNKIIFPIHRYDGRQD